MLQIQLLFLEKVIKNKMTKSLTRKLLAPILLTGALTLPLTSRAQEDINIKKDPIFYVYAGPGIFQGDYQTTQTYKFFPAFGGGLYFYILQNFGIDAKVSYARKTGKPSIYTEDNSRVLNSQAEREVLHTEFLLRYLFPFTLMGKTRVACEAGVSVAQVTDKKSADISINSFGTEYIFPINERFEITNPGFVFNICFDIMLSEDNLFLFLNYVSRVNTFDYKSGNIDVGLNGLEFGLKKGF